ncbi:MAG: AmmeMemoRadiSam system protein B [Candidatus Aenigmatarchaeota archaeon]
MRPPSAAGKFYPKDPQELASELELFFQSQKPDKYFPNAKGIIVPHAGYMFSGAVAAKTYNAVSGTDKRNIEILGVDHHNKGVIATLKQDWMTPFGAVKVNLPMLEKIMKGQAIVEDAEAVRHEHSIEVQLPFLQYMFGGFVFVPLQIPRLSYPEIQDLARIIADMDTLFIASSDLIHFGSDYGFVPKECIYGPEDFVKDLDEKIMSKILEMDPKRFMEYIEDNDLTVCGLMTITLFLEIMKLLGAKKAEIIDHDTSFSISHDTSAIVGYGGLVFE